MSDTKWTPGPWRIGRYHHVVLPNPDCQKSEGGGEGICHVYGDAHKRVANSHLIAAAPELYEALEDALHFMESVGPPRYVRMQCESALAKARGQS